LEYASESGPQARGARAIRLRIRKPASYALHRAGCEIEIDDTMAELKLALTEAVSNSVRHAYGPNGNGHVDVTYDLRPDMLAIEVVDDGAGFDPEEAPGFQGDELSEGGLGISIIRSIADEFEIDSALGQRGSRLRFAKRL
jgi:serine/threonine-protein kinase RsbW